MAFYCKEEHFVNINASDIIIIALIVVAALLAGAYYLNKKTMRRMIQAQDFIDQNRMTVQAFIIDKKQEKPSATNLPKAVFDQLPKMAKMRKANLVKAKIGPQIVTLMCDKPVYEVLPVKKSLKVDIAGMYIVSVTGMNLADKKKKSFTEKMTTRMNSMVSDQSEKQKTKNKTKSKRTVKTVRFFYTSFIPPWDGFPRQKASMPGRQI